MLMASAHDSEAELLYVERQDYAIRFLQNAQTLMTVKLVNALAPVQILGVPSRPLVSRLLLAANKAMPVATVLFQRAVSAFALRPVNVFPFRLLVLYHMIVAAHVFVIRIARHGANLRRNVSKFHLSVKLMTIVPTA